MPAPTSVDEFLDLIQKSGVTESARVKGYVQKLAESGQPIKKTDRVAEAMVRDGVLTFFQAEQLLQGKWKRFFIGKYKVLERIGVGGMGQVFLCEHKLMKRRVALKVLPAVKAQDPASLERFYKLVPETPAVYTHWKAILNDFVVNGKLGHDAHLVAGMLANGITEILTFNDQDFIRFTGITTVNPKNVVVMSPPSDSSSSQSLG